MIAVKFVVQMKTLIKLVKISLLSRSENQGSGV